MDSKFTKVQQKYKELENQNATLKYRLKIVEKKVKSENLIFYGVGENDLEIYIPVQLELKITNFRNEEFTVCRIGKKMKHFYRPILLFSFRLVEENKLLQRVLQ